MIRTSCEHVVPLIAAPIVSEKRERGCGRGLTSLSGHWIRGPGEVPRPLTQPPLGRGRGRQGNKASFEDSQRRRCLRQREAGRRKLSVGPFDSMLLLLSADSYQFCDGEAEETRSLAPKTVSFDGRFAATGFLYFFLDLIPPPPCYP